MTANVGKLNSHNNIQSTQGNTKAKEVQNKEKSLFDKFDEWTKTGTESYDKLNKKFDELVKKVDSGKMSFEESLKELDKLDKEGESLDTFNFMEKEYTDADKYIKDYVANTGELAQGTIDSWDTSKDGKLSFEEYLQEEKNSADYDKLSKGEQEELTKQADNVFKAIDINEDGVMSKNEIQGFYAALDNNDGANDGKISTKAFDFGNKENLEKIHKDAGLFQKYLED